MTRLRHLIGLVTLAALATTSAHATLRRPDLPTLSTGVAHDGTQSELWFSVVDTTRELSYSLDLGVTIAQLRATNADAGNLSGLAPAGSSLAADFVKASDATRDYAFWVVSAAKDSSGWGGFVSATGGLGNATWAVMGVDSLGSSGAGQRGFLSTVQQGQEASFRDVSNSAINQLAGGTLSSFVGTGLNSRPSHAVATDPSGDLESSVAINGASFDSKNTSPDAYFGGVIDAFGGLNSPLMVNPVGQSAWFYDVTRSSTSNLAKASVNEFDNLAGDAYWGFTAESGNTGRYLLSYTMPRYLSPTETAAGLTFENNFARLAGVLSLNDGVGQADTVVSLTEGFLRRLAVRQQALGLAGDGMKTTLDLEVSQALEGSMLVSAVPEPGTWGLMALGLAALGWRMRRPGP